MYILWKIWASWLKELKFFCRKSIYFVLFFGCRFLIQNTFYLVLCKYFNCAFQTDFIMMLILFPTKSSSVFSKNFLMTWIGQRSGKLNLFISHCISDWHFSIRRFAGNVYFNEFPSMISIIDTNLCFKLLVHVTKIKNKNWKH